MSKIIRSPDERYEIEFHKHVEYMTVEFIVDDPNHRDTGDTSYEPVLTGHFGYDGCIHIRAPYHHYCEISHIQAVLNLVAAAHKAALAGEVEGYKALR